MNLATASAKLTGLWPSSDWTPDIAELFWGRVAKLDLTTEQVLEVLDEHKVVFRYKSPVVGDLLAKMRVKAAGPRATRPHDSLIRDEPDRETCSLSDFMARKKELGEEVHFKSDKGEHNIRRVQADARGASSAKDTDAGLKYREPGA